MKNISATLSAECLKLKRTPIIYLAIAVSFFIAFVLFIGHYLDVHNLARININPWKRYFNSGSAIYTNFFICLFSVLITSAVLYIEHNANTWKYLYTMPVYRGSIYFSKVIILVGLLFLTAILLIASIVSSAYLLGYFYPEFEFYYYTPHIWDFFIELSHNTIAILGLVGFQYFLSLNFKNFFIPLGIGVLGFVLGLILGSTNQKMALYFPYAYPIIIKDFDMFNQDGMGIVRDGWLSNVEWYSLGYFVFFILLGYWNELRKNVK